MTDDIEKRTVASWDALAEFWDERAGDDGEPYKRFVIDPSVDAMLAAERGQTILDLGCGNGYYARKLARLGVRVIAVDAAPQMIERARARGGHIDTGW